MLGANPSDLTSNDYNLTTVFGKSCFWSKFLIVKHGIKWLGENSKMAEAEKKKKYYYYKKKEKKAKEVVKKKPAKKK
jgi:hypothetical protein